VVGLPEPLIVLLRVHRVRQEAERTAAASSGTTKDGWVLAKPDGRPLNPNTDYHEWKALIEEAGLPERRLQDARHTATTVLAILADGNAII
jgi:integrase